MRFLGPSFTTSPLPDWLPVHRSAPMELSLITKGRKSWHAKQLGANRRHSAVETSDFAEQVRGFVRQMHRPEGGLGNTSPTGLCWPAVAQQHGERYDCGSETKHAQKRNRGPGSIEGKCRPTGAAGR